MTLIGMRGANLLNKAGHEALANKQEGNDGNAVSYGNTTAQAVQYKSYPNEPLNPRIANPVLQGNCLVATIDRVPYTIQLPEHVVGAYQAGALPSETPSLMSSNTTSFTMSFCATQFATVAPTFPAPTTVTFDIVLFN